MNHVKQNVDKKKLTEKLGYPKQYNILMMPLVWLGICQNHWWGENCNSNGDKSQREGMNDTVRYLIWNNRF